MSKTRFYILVCGTCLGYLAAGGARADESIYQYRDQRGRVTFTDRAPSAIHHHGNLHYVGTWTWKGWLKRRYNPALRNANRERFAPAIAAAARRARLSVALVHAVVDAESAYDPDAVSRAGAVGLMQLMPATARHYGVYKRTDPEQNLDGGTRYLSYLLERFDGDLRISLAAYNAGENAVMRYGRRIPPYPETRTYVRRVLDYFDAYKKRYHDVPLQDG